MKYILCISVLSTILLQAIVKITGFGDLCYSGYHHCSGTSWCCPNGYVCTGTTTCLSTGLIVGIVIGCLVGVGIFIGVICACVRHRNNAGTLLQTQGGAHVVTAQSGQTYPQSGQTYPQSGQTYPQSGYPGASYPQQPGYPQAYPVPKY
ncbi:cysteine and tyrosine-rich protein 1-like isoform X1 [Mytilus californianus]|uniref:cysteine and tyrosine-rich protein 1-like isoform X1 n=1 Tax=Mytilus californianus TaxID=6549 RepID=UPI0022464D7B|nr:cysteine and tyrosine-rich protein 1-like isoform X1 [Mytilus californianus]